MEEFDYIIVGAGSAGSVLANRLAESGARILVLEAGPADRSFFISMPAGYSKTLFNPSITWQFETEGSWGTNHRRLAAPQGKVVGGTSAINGLAFVRGQAEDYNSWQAMGNSGWSYAEVLPYFKRLERRLPADPRLRGTDGPVVVSDPDWRHPLSEAFIDSAKAVGIPSSPDYNGASREGTGYYQRNIHQGLRISAARAYLNPVLKRANVQLTTGAHVTSIQLDGKQVVGVRYRDGRGQQIAKVRHEVLLCAGALNSPKLLELSGIGAPDVLTQAGLPVNHALSGVGENLQDHFGIRLVVRVKNSRSINNLVRGPALVWELIRWSLGRPSVLSNSAVMCFAFPRPGDLGRVDTTIAFTPASYRQGQLGVLDDHAGATISAWQMRPFSRGHVHMSSASPDDQPIIQPNYLGDERDRQAVIDLTRKAREILHAQPFSNFLDQEVMPGKAITSDPDVLNFARNHGAVCHHWSGSCRMGPAEKGDSVVDHELKIHGLEGIRVVDASILPCIVSANTYATVLMIAEKAADMILGKPPLPAERPVGEKLAASA